MTRSEITAKADRIAAEVEQRRSSAFWGAPKFIGPIPVGELTLRSLSILSATDSALLSPRKDNPLTDSEILRFAWAVSAFDSTDTEARDRFIKQYAKINFNAAFDDMVEYIKEAFSDAPSGKCGAGYPPVGSVARTVYRIAKLFGWSVDYIMSMPLRQIHQLIACDDCYGGDFVVNPALEFQVMESNREVLERQGLWPS